MAQAFILHNRRPQQRRRRWLAFVAPPTVRASKPLHETLSRNLRLLVLRAMVTSLSFGGCVNNQYAADYPRDLGITLGDLADTNPGIKGVNVSDQFGTNELERFLEYLNSPAFQAGLTNYNCGDPGPQFKFRVNLRKGDFNENTNGWRVIWEYIPHLDPSDINRGLDAGLFYLPVKALFKIDPGPNRLVTRKPVLDCSKRGSSQLWVTYPKPNEILVSGNAPVAPNEPENEMIPLLSLPGLAPPGRRARLIAREESLGRIPADAAQETLTVDPKFKHVAFVVKRGEKEAVVVDGVEGKAYDKIARRAKITFGPDGSRFAYVASRGSKMLVVVDGKEGREYDWIDDLFNPEFSPDGKHVAYVAGVRALAFPPLKEFVVVDSKEGKHYATAHTPAFSNDSRRTAHSAERNWNRGMFVVADGVEQKTYHQIMGVVFSPDGNRLAYEAMTLKDRAAKRPIWEFAVIDGREEKQYDVAHALVFSPDSKHYAYIAVELSGTKPVLVRDGTPIKYGNLMPDGQPLFSADSQHLACRAHNQDRDWMILMDGKILDKDLGEFTSGLVFSPDGRYLAYASHESDAPWAVVVNSHVLKTYESVRHGPIFSPDSKRLAYVISHGGKYVPVFGEFEGKEYDQFATCDFWTSKGNGWGVRFAGFAFDDRGVLHAIALRANEILRLELEVVDE